MPRWSPRGLVVDGEVVEMMKGDEGLDFLYNNFMYNFI